MVTFGICLYYLICYCFSFLTGLANANKEETVTVNKPIVKSMNSWHFSTDYVRCFCNLPTCVTTGYMCKSSNGGCFSDVTDRTNQDKGRHGCIELLEEKYRCHKTGINEKTTFRKKENSKSRLMCCHHDMCNHIENPQTKNLINATNLDTSSEETDAKYQQREEKFLYSESEVWFRAATIAVPICGAVILFVLIALAVKILKSEHQNLAINKLGPTLYIQPVSQQKHSKEKYSQDNFHRTYDNFLRKDYDTSPHNNFYSTRAEEYQGQFHEPLLQPSRSDEKNRNHARYNLVNYEDSGKSIILEIEKEKPISSQVNYTGGVNKFPVEKTFLS